MDFETQRKKRMEALEEKRKRLEEMKKLRKDRAEEPTEISAPAPAPVDDRAAVDSLVNSLLVSDRKESKEDVETKDTNTKPQPTNAVNVMAPVSRAEVVRQKASALGLVRSIGQVHVQPSLVETYEKECQTDEVEGINNNDGLGGVDWDATSATPLKSSAASVAKRSSATSASYSSLKPPAGGLSVLRSPAPVASASAVISSSPPSPDPTCTSSLGQFLPLPLPLPLSEEEKKEIIESEEFLSFFSHTSLIVERSLAQKESSNAVDILRDYREDSLRARGGPETCALELLQTVFEDDSVRLRPVMDLQCSPHYPELFLAAYGSRNNHNSSSTGTSSGSSTAAGAAGHASSSSSSSSWQMVADAEEDAPGMVCIWSQAFLGKPEFKFFSSSPVLTARFHPTEPHFIIGGCYNGQILLWDMRAKSLPVQRSSMSGKGHKHPVYAMSITGTAAAQELVSVSTDGTLCHWDLSRLTEPTNVSTLSSNNSLSSSLNRGGGVGVALTGDAGSNAISVSSMAFSREESSKSRDIILGSGTGQIYRSSLPYRQNDPVSQIDAHMGLVTSMQMHPSPSKLFKNLLLTSSLDWTIKLWNLQASKQPLFQFSSPSYDYVCDVQWSPTNPALFTTISSGGSLALWNLSKSTSEPVESISIRAFRDSDDSPSPSTGGTTASATASAAVPSGTSNTQTPTAALNKSVWSRDGRSILIGDAKGVVHLVSVKEAASKWSSAEEARLELTLLNIKESSSSSTATAEAKAADESFDGSAIDSGAETEEEDD